MPRWVSVILVGLFVAVIGCSEDKPNNMTVSAGDSPDEVFADFVTQESDSGQLQWRLTAPQASRFTKKKVVILDNPVIDFFDKEGALSTTLVSEKGEYSEDNGDLLAYGSVVVRSVNGDVLETDSLLWNNKADKIQSQSFVKLTRGQDVMTGIGMECDPNLTSVDIKRDVKAVIVDEDGQIVE